MNRNKLFKPALTALLGAIVLAMSLIPQIGFLTIFPGLAIMLSILAFNMLGDGIRDALDPKLRER